MSYRYRGHGHSRELNAISDTLGRSGFRLDSSARTDSIATDDWFQAPRPADEETDDSGASSKHDGVTTQSMNCHRAATKVMSNRTVAIAWASK